MKPRNWAIFVCVLAFLNVSVFAGTSSSTDKPPKANAKATYGIPLIYTDGEVLNKPSEAEWIDTEGNSGEYDMTLPMTYCPPASEMICVRYGDGEDFSVPRKVLHINDSWTFDAIRFVVLPSVVTYVPGDMRGNAKALSEISLLGQRITFYVIAQMGKNGNIPVHLYFYSPERGLIGDAKPAEGTGIRPNWLQEAYGPGSKEYDSHIATSALLSKAEADKLIHATASIEQ